MKNATLQDLHGRAKELIAQLDWFSIGHALREHNQEADRLANEAMDTGHGEECGAGCPRPRMPVAPTLHGVAGTLVRGTLGIRISKASYETGTIELL